MHKINIPFIYSVLKLFFMCSLHMNSFNYVSKSWSMSLS